MNYTTTWTLNLISNSVTKGLEKISSVTNFLTERMSKLGDCIKRVQAIDLMAIENSVQNVKNGIQSFTDLAVKNESALAEVSAITGVTGEELDKLGDKARRLAKDFGTTASDNLGLFQTILSRLGPQIG